MLKIAITKRASRQLNGLAPTIRRLVEAKIAQYAADPQALTNNVRALRGGGLRLRVQDWRVVFEVADGAMKVVRIAHRREAYD